jgi:hypothetical protein
LNGELAGLSLGLKKKSVYPGREVYRWQLVVST